MAKSILYIEPNRAFFYAATLTQPVGFNFTTESVQDGELVSREKLAALIDRFLVSNQLPPGQIDFVVSSFLTFEKVLSTPQQPETKDAMQNFLELVPYENVASLTVNVKGQKWSVATNKTLIDNFKSILEQHKWTVGAAVPFSVLQQFVPELQQQVDLPTMLAKVDTIRQHTFFNAASAPRPIVTTTNPDVPHPLITKDKPNKKNMILLGSVFGVLLIVLGYMIYNSMAPQKPASLLLTPTPGQAITRPSIAPSSGSTSANLTPSRTPQISQPIR